MASKCELTSSAGLGRVLALVAVLAGPLGCVGARRDTPDAALDSGRVRDAAAAADADARVEQDAPAVPQLTDAHPGWQRQLCFECHGVIAPYPHTAEAYRPPDCRACHGSNGAPHPEHAVLEGGDCRACHGTVAHAAAFNSPDDCIACHRP